MLIYRIAKLFHTQPRDVSDWTMDEALLYCDLDKYAGHVEREHIRKMRAQAERERRG